MQSPSTIVNFSTPELIINTSFTSISSSNSKQALFVPTLANLSLPSREVVVHENPFAFLTTRTKSKLCLNGVGLASYIPRAKVGSDRMSGRLKSGFSGRSKEMVHSSLTKIKGSPEPFGRSYEPEPTSGTSNVNACASSGSDAACNVINTSANASSSVLRPEKGKSTPSVKDYNTPTIHSSSKAATQATSSQPGDSISQVGCLKNRPLIELISRKLAVNSTQHHVTFDEASVRKQSYQNNDGFRSGDVSQNRKAYVQAKRKSRDFEAANHKVGTSTVSKKVIKTNIDAPPASLPTDLVTAKTRLRPPVPLEDEAGGRFSAALILVPTKPPRKGKKGKESDENANTMVAPSKIGNGSPPDITTQPKQRVGAPGDGIKQKKGKKIRRRRSVSRPKSSATCAGTEPTIDRVIRRASGSIVIKKLKLRRSQSDTGRSNPTSTGPTVKNLYSDNNDAETISAAFEFLPKRVKSKRARSARSRSARKQNKSAVSSELDTASKLKGDEVKKDNTGEEITGRQQLKEKSIVGDAVGNSSKAEVDKVVSLLAAGDKDMKAEAKTGEGSDVKGTGETPERSNNNDATGVKSAVPSESPKVPHSPVFPGMYKYVQRPEVEDAKATLESLNNSVELDAVSEKVDDRTLSTGSGSEFGIKEELTGHVETSKTPVSVNNVTCNARHNLETLGKTNTRTDIAFSSIPKEPMFLGADDTNSEHEIGNKIIPVGNINVKSTSSLPQAAFKVDQSRLTSKPPASTCITTRPLAPNCKYISASATSSNDHSSRKAPTDMQRGIPSSNKHTSADLHKTFEKAYPRQLDEVFSSPASSLNQSSQTNASRKNKALTTPTTATVTKTSTGKITLSQSSPSTTAMKPSTKLSNRQTPSPALPNRAPLAYSAPTSPASSIVGRDTFTMARSKSNAFLRSKKKSSKKSTRRKSCTNSVRSEKLKPETAPGNIKKNVSKSGSRALEIFLAKFNESGNSNLNSNPGESTKGAVASLSKQAEAKPTHATVHKHKSDPAQNQTDVNTNRPPSRQTLQGNTNTNIHTSSHHTPKRDSNTNRPTTQHTLREDTTTNIPTSSHLTPKRDSNTNRRRTSRGESEEPSADPDNETEGLPSPKASNENVKDNDGPEEPREKRDSDKSGSGKTSPAATSTSKDEEITSRGGKGAPATDGGEGSETVATSKSARSLKSTRSATGSAKKKKKKVTLPEEKVEPPKRESKQLHHRRKSSSSRLEFHGWDGGKELAPHEMTELPGHVDVSKMLLQHAARQEKREEEFLNSCDISRPDPGPHKDRDEPRAYLAKHGLQGLFVEFTANILNERPQRPVESMALTARQIERQVQTKAAMTAKFPFLRSEGSMEKLYLASQPRSAKRSKDEGDDGTSIRESQLTIPSSSQDLLDEWKPEKVKRASLTDEQREQRMTMTSVVSSKASDDKPSGGSAESSGSNELGLGVSGSSDESADDA